MADITTPANIPTGKRAAVKAVVERIGPQIIPNLYPKEADGTTPKAILSAGEANAAFEQITREFWRQQIEAYEVNAAAEAARVAAVAANAGDPFA